MVTGMLIPRVVRPNRTITARRRSLKGCTERQSMERLEPTQHTWDDLETVLGAQAYRCGETSLDGEVAIAKRHLWAMTPTEEDPSLRRRGHCSGRCVGVRRDLDGDGVAAQGAVLLLP